MWAVRYLLLLILIVVILGFAILNSSQRVLINLPHTSLPGVPLTVVILCAFCVGMLVSFVLMVAQALKMSGQVRQRRKRVQQLEMELAALRNRSLEDIEQLEESEVKAE
jgi:uncharacterized integral membrane protein